MHVGLACEKAARSSLIHEQVAVVDPISSSVGLQEYVATSPMDVPVNVTCPLVGLMGVGHTAVRLYKIKEFGTI